MKPLLAAVIAVVAATAAALGVAVAREENPPISSDDGVRALVVPVGSSERVGSTQVGITLTTVEGASLTSPTAGVVTAVAGGVVRVGVRVRGCAVDVLLSGE